MSSFARVVLCDRRGTGLSDPFGHPPLFEEQQFALVGAADLGLCAMFAATFPERVTALEGERGVHAGQRATRPRCRVLLAFQQANHAVRVTGEFVRSVLRAPWGSWAP